MKPGRALTESIGNDIESLIVSCRRSLFLFGIDGSGGPSRARKREVKVESGRAACLVKAVNFESVVAAVTHSPDVQRAVEEAEVMIALCRYSWALYQRATRGKIRYNDDVVINK